jgi:hypothetical protein
MKLIKHQQFLTLRCLDIIKTAYDQDSTAADEGHATPHPAPSIHTGIKPVEPIRQLEQYQ